MATKNGYGHGTVARSYEEMATARRQGLNVDKWLQPWDSRSIQ
jgi:hypothetical protein